jgi:DNA end-binding protein Ku
MAPRAIWKGFLTLSLVSIPIKVFAATEESEKIKFNELHEPCQSRMQQKRWCPKCEREVKSSEIVKGFEFEAGKYVLLLPEELDAVQPPSTKVIDLTQFAGIKELPYLAIDRAYFLVPDCPDGGPANAAYALLVDAMIDQVGIGTLAIYGREYLVAVSPRRGSLLLYTLHHAAELRDAPYVASTHATGKAELTLARQVIAGLRRPLALEAFTDAYQADVRRLIDAKIAGQEIVQPAMVEPVPTLTLQAALEQSLAALTKKSMAKATVAPKRKQAS